MKHGTCDFLELVFENEEDATDFVEGLNRMLRKYDGDVTLGDALERYGATSYDSHFDTIKVPKVDTFSIEHVYRISIPYNFTRTFD